MTIPGASIEGVQHALAEEAANTDFGTSRQVECFGPFYGGSRTNDGVDAGF
jgi:hypothetical protein